MSDFYAQSAISALQGLMEQGGIYGTVEDWAIPPKILASKAFDIADAMVNEYNHRLHIKK